MSTKRAIALNAKDNVAVALEYIEAGDEVNVEVKGSAAVSIQALEEIPFGFKLALMDISEGSDVVKYGKCMGKATFHIKRGMQVHVHNVQGVRVRSQGESE